MTLSDDSIKSATRLNKKINTLRENKTSYMNNTKWFKFLSALHQMNISNVDVKFLAQNNMYSFHTALAGEKGVEDGLCGPFYYYEIEYISILVKDTDSIIKLMNQLGSYEYELTEDNIKIFGYK